MLKFSAGQWNTLVNIGLALCGLAGQDCTGTNTADATAQKLASLNETLRHELAAARAQLSGKVVPLRKPKS
ncbi:hypothetical protein J2W24_005872 [Variovorax boronicumulans]|nr:hypothetical protein [Variovorax boronicumulans]